MDTHGQPSTEAGYALPHYYTNQTPAAVATSESWKNHQEQYSSSFSSSIAAKEEYSTEVDRYQQTSIGGQTITVPPSSGSPYNQETQSLLLWSRSSSIPADDIGEGRGAPPYDCY